MHVGYDGAKKPTSMIDFPTLKCIIIEENNKFIKDLEEDLDLYVRFFVSILTQFDLIFLFSYFMCILII